MRLLVALIVLGMLYGIGKYIVGFAMVTYYAVTAGG